MKSMKLKKFMSVALSFSMCFTLIENVIRTDIVKADSNSQSDIPTVEAWPNIPSPFNIRDWNKTANDFYDLAFNTKAKGTDFPMIKTFNVNTPSTGGFIGETFTMPSYLSSSWSRNATPGYGEGVATLPAVLGASLMGKNMTKFRNKNWVKMIETYYSKTEDGRGFISNNPSKLDSTDSFWYDLYPTILFSQIASLYPKETTIQEKMKDVNNSWLEALKVLDNNWDKQGFSFKDMTAVGSDHLEPDASIGVAYIEYMPM
ncbi:MAG: hypothetical protein ACREVX_09930 [Clostridium sp.]|uniref:hypothetical protein n=1 Tax=Clostridium sp. TaxID=1506 RepID=UPI003D6D2A9A